ncbi:tripartite tricarboxylate transporter substrate binding protein [Ramlibacter sp. AN1015]|uniref:Bug family tripartite tricarboxylate transporter substrate binding protein n=1 Tax=Ramlibacter sp. AN1015 TaxID=3133428 RepID=UPI0030C16BFC
MNHRTFPAYSIARRTLLAGALAALSGGVLAQQGYPDKPIRIVVPFAPAGAADILGRILSEKLGAMYGQTVVVDNRPGASGHVGAQLAAKSPGDGYTLMVGTIGIHAAHASYRKLQYDPAADLQPIAVLGESPNLVVVPVNSPYKTFGDLLADAKANPGKISYATAGAGSSVHMVTALFELNANVKMNHIPYKGSGPALIDLISGQVNVMFDNMSSSIPHVRGGKLRVLAVTSGQRDPLLPDVPTIAESGVPGYSGTSWWTLAAPRATPPALIEKLSRDLHKVMATPDVKAKLTSLGIAFTPHTPQQAAAFFESETEKWNRVIEAAKVQLD